LTITAYSKQFKRLVSIETPDGDIEDFVSTDATWSEIAKAWAEIIPLTGDEYIQAREINPRVSHRIRMRWNDDYDTTRTRFVWNGRTFHTARALNLDDRNRVWEFICSEEVS
jgi:SPP1 family predicted phage head-tail adaptor